jgi:regulatory protein
MTDFADDLTICRNRALNLLARREHSQQELQAKLLAKAFDAAIITQVLEQLVAKDLLSDARFAELYTEQRSRKGYGPAKIRQELHQRGVSAGLIEQMLAIHANSWQEYARLAWGKYLRTHSVPEQPKELALKQQKFLYARGFDGDCLRCHPR